MRKLKYDLKKTMEIFVVCFYNRILQHVERSTRHTRYRPLTKVHALGRTASSAARSQTSFACTRRTTQKGASCDQHRLKPCGASAAGTPVVTRRRRGRARGFPQDGSTGRAEGRGAFRTCVSFSAPRPERRLSGRTRSMQASAGWARRLSQKR